MSSFTKSSSRDSETGLLGPGDLSGVYKGILNDDAHMLRECFHESVNFNCCFKGDSGLQHIGMTPLALAAALNKLEAIEFLLTHGANINDTFASLRTTALMTSAFHGHVKVVEKLLRHGANVQAIDLQGSTALGYAFGGSRSLEVIELLIKSGININQKNMLGMNALLLVAGYGDDRLVKMVLASQADPNAVNDFGHSALHLVIVGKRSQLKKLVQDNSNGISGKLTLDNFNSLKSAEVAMKDWAARNRHIQTDSKKLEKAANLMSNIGTKVQKTFLKAVDDNEQEVIKQRVEAMWLYRQEKLIACKKLLKKSGKLESLLNCRGKKEREDNETARPYLSVPSRSSKSLHTEKDKEMAGLKDKFASILTMIAKAGCDVALTEKTFGLTALDMAILLEDVESTGALISLGADPEHLLKMFALSDLHESITSGDKRLVEKLIAYDSDLDLNHYFSAFNVEMKSGEGEEVVEGVVSEGMTPLCVAVQMPEEDGTAIKIAKILIKNKADVDKAGPAGSFPLAEAARAGNLRMCQLLLSHGAEVEQTSARYNNATPFLISAIFNRVDVAQFLSDRNAKMDAETTDGRCALTEAYRNDNMRLIEIVMRGSLASAFNRRSFTYEVVAKYQRPDKNMNLIMKLIGHQVKKLEEIKSDVKPKFLIEPRSETQTNRLLPQEAAKETLAKHSDFPVFVDTIDEEKMVKSVEKTLEIELKKTDKLKKDGVSEVSKGIKNENKKFVSKRNDDLEKEAASSMNESRGSLREADGSVQKCLQEASEQLLQVRDGTRSKLDVAGKQIRRSVESPMKSLIFKAEQASEKLKKGKSKLKTNPSFENEDIPDKENSSSQKKAPASRWSQHPQASEDSNKTNYSENGSREKEEEEVEEEEEEWEDDKCFKEHYYPASSYESKQEACMMTTPILGRCSQVRNNFAQADNYLKDVVSAGNSKRFNAQSAIRSIEPDASEEEEEEEENGQTTRISSQFYRLSSKSKQRSSNS